MDRQGLRDYFLELARMDEKSGVDPVRCNWIRGKLKGMSESELRGLKLRWDEHKRDKILGVAGRI